MIVTLPWALPTRPAQPDISERSGAGASGLRGQAQTRRGRRSADVSV